MELTCHLQLQAYSPSPIPIKAGTPTKAQADGPKHKYDGCSISDFIQGPILGTGSFGRVSLAHHRVTGDVCAIKALSKAHLVKNQQACPGFHHAAHVGQNVLRHIQQATQGMHGFFSAPRSIVSVSVLGPV